MSKIEIKKCVYNIHPVYDLYAADKNGNIMNIVKKVPIKGNKLHSGYMMCCKKACSKRTKKLLHPSVCVGMFQWYHTRRKGD